MLKGIFKVSINILILVFIVFFQVAVLYGLENGKVALVEAMILYALSFASCFIAGRHFADGIFEIQISLRKKGGEE